MADPYEIEALADRALRALRRPGARLSAAAGLYQLRVGDRRRRPLFSLGEPVFQALARRGALAAAGEGAWVLSAQARATGGAPDKADKPGLLEGERAVVEDDGRVSTRRANLGESPVAWLLRRGHLTPVEAAAAEKLREDFVRAGQLGRLVMDWNAAPQGSAARSRGPEPAERARFAKDRLAAALDAAGPEARALIERVCLAEANLQAAERALGIPRRNGKIVLKRGLQRLAKHYGVG